MKAVVVIGDSNGHVGLGIKTAKEVASAIKAAIVIAKLSIIPIRRGYGVLTWVNHTLCHVKSLVNVVPLPLD